MAATLVQQKTSTGSDPTPGELTFDNSVTAGNFVVWRGMFTAGLGDPAVTDSQSNTYAIGHSRDQRGFRCAFAAAIITSGGSSFKVTATLATATFDSQIIQEWSSDAAVSTTADATGGADGAGTTLSCTTGAMSQNDGVAFAIGASDNAKAPGTGWTEDAELNAAAGTAYDSMVVTAGGAITATMTQTSASWGITACVYKAAAAGGGATFGDVRSHVRGTKRGMFLRLHGVNR